MQIKVRNIGRHADGYWIAEAAVVAEGEPAVYLPVHRKWGSWMYGYGTEQRDARHNVAAELQRQVKKLEKAERLNGESGASKMTQAAHPFIVGVNANPPIRLRRFRTEDEAARFIDTLEGAKDGRYYIDNMNESEP